MVYLDQLARPAQAMAAPPTEAVMPLCTPETFNPTAARPETLETTDPEAISDQVCTQDPGTLGQAQTSFEFLDAQAEMPEAPDASETDSAEPEADEPDLADGTAAETAEGQTSSEGGFEAEGPSLDDIRHGAVLEPGQSSTDLPQLLEMLSKAGYPVRHLGDRLDGELLHVLKQFQQDAGIAAAHSEHASSLGRNTLAALERS
ncbi:MAG: hypothetical protein ACAI44_28405 [Candidatus Sericytochromatia bacterium]